MTLVPPIDGVGSGFTVTVLDATAVQPVGEVAVTVYVVVLIGETVIPEVTAPVFQRYELPPVEFKVVLWPSQIMLVPEIEGVGSGLTVTVLVPVAVQPDPFVTVTK